MANLNVSMTGAEKGGEGRGRGGEGRGEGGEGKGGEREELEKA